MPDEPRTEPAAKVGGRWEARVHVGSDSAGHQLVVTRRGVEVFGWYDSYVGTGPTIELSWAELAALRDQVNRGALRP